MRWWYSWWMMIEWLSWGGMSADYQGLQTILGTPFDQLVYLIGIRVFWIAQFGDKLPTRNQEEDFTRTVVIVSSLSRLSCQKNLEPTMVHGHQHVMSTSILGRMILCGVQFQWEVHSRKAWMMGIGITKWGMWARILDLIKWYDVMYLLVN